MNDRATLAETPVPPQNGRRRRSVRQIAISLAWQASIAAGATWLVSLILCWTIEPRRGTYMGSDMFSLPSTFIAKQTWEAGASSYVEVYRQHDYRRSWGPEQAIGSPDTRAYGDIDTAWAPQLPDSPGEWLKLSWTTPVAARSISIYQSYNAGAVARVTVASPAGAETTVYTAIPAPLPLPTPVGPVVLVIPFDASLDVLHVTLHLDTAAVPGWNEIDAVCLRDADGVFRGADHAAASSTYAERNSSPVSQIDVPRWCPLDAPIAAFQSGTASYEHRAAGAFGWPLKAWVGTELLVSGAVAPTGRPAIPQSSGPMRVVPYRPIVVGVLVNSVVYFGAAWLFAAIVLRPLRPLRRMLRMQRGCCPSCGYDLCFDFPRGCPECGFLRSEAQSATKRAEP